MGKAGWTGFRLSEFAWQFFSEKEIDGCATRRAVALRRQIFKQKKGFANLSLGLNYHSKALPQPPSRDTVPLSRLFFSTSRHIFPAKHFINFQLTNSGIIGRKTSKYIVYRRKGCIVIKSFFTSFLTKQYRKLYLMYFLYRYLINTNLTLMLHALYIKIFIEKVYCTVG
jgi:hypothetical protein